MVFIYQPVYYSINTPLAHAQSMSR
jgi:hypothetical protein